MMDWAKSILFGRQGPVGVSTPESGRAVALTCSDEGVLYVALASGSDGAITQAVPNSDALPVTGGGAVRGIGTLSWGYLFNGSTWDRERANTEETILASAARTATTNSADFTNFNARGGHFQINVTSITATPSITPTIQGKDPVSGTYYDILVGTAITTTGITILKVYPGILAIANGAASDILPRTYRVSVAHGDADSITYSVGASLVL